MPVERLMKCANFAFANASHGGAHIQGFEAARKRIFPGLSTGSHGDCHYSSAIVNVLKNVSPGYQGVLACQVSSLILTDPSKMLIGEGPPGWAEHPSALEGPKLI